MDPSSYKDHTTTRGINYHYFYSAAKEGKPTILFVHGFPSTSFDWHKQVAYFQPLGYGLLVPDMLGCGGTDKPLDMNQYLHSLMAKDVVDILDAEKLEKTIAIGHDWGAGLVSRLANYFPDHFAAFGFFALPYMVPNPDFDIGKVNEMAKNAVGYEMFGYWEFFSEDGAAKLMEDNIDVVQDVCFPEDPTRWARDLAPLGAMKKTLMEKKRGPRAAYATDELTNALRNIILKGGLSAPLNWYKIQTSGLAAADDRNVPTSRYVVEKPVFYGGALKDYICLVSMGKPQVLEFCKNPTIRLYDADHWVIFSHPDELNKDLHEWVEKAI